MPPKFSPKIVVDRDFMSLPQLGMLAHYCGKPKLHAAGALLRLWMHIQSRADNRVVDISKVAIDIAVEIPGFASAMIDANLATQIDGTTMEFDLFDEYISRNAVRRSKNAESQQARRGDRAGQGVCYDDKLASPASHTNKPPRKKSRPDPQRSLIPPEPPVLAFPCIGEHREWLLTQSQVDEWAKLYDGFDVLAELKKALAWAKVNRKKTWKGMPAFCVNWLNRAVNSGRPASRQLPASASPETLKKKIRDEMEAKRKRDEENNRGGNG